MAANMIYVSASFPCTFFQEDTTRLGRLENLSSTPKTNIKKKNNTGHNCT